MRIGLDSPRRAAVGMFLGTLSLLVTTRVALADPDSTGTSMPVGHVVRMPYAGKYEARIGGSRESANDKLRLDIGASVDLLTKNVDGSDGDRDDAAVGRYSFGADFFTWTRLRSAGGFKFPVEAVDYYFGVNGQYESLNGFPFEARLRVAHISAHIVDGDPSFADTATTYITYSREFVDLTLLAPHEIVRIGRGAEVRPYVGAQWLFHTIPDTLGRVTPYAGFDVRVMPFTTNAIGFKLGYEARLNTELEPIGEHLFRLGVQLGDLFNEERGVSVETSYYSGRSAYGQHFWKRESFWSLGFAVDF